MHNIMHDIRYIPIFNISIQFKLCRYCITGLMYHDMAIYRYIVASLHDFMCNYDSFQFSDITNPYTPVRDYSIYGKRLSHESKYRGKSLPT